MWKALRGVPSSALCGVVGVSVFTCERVFLVLRHIHVQLNVFLKYLSPLQFS
jgi:hypothetical protein